MRLSPSRQAELDRLIARPFAHRGLHGPGRPENSRAAFAAAIAAGHGIELDVRLSSDGVPIVFHDMRLDRLTDLSGEVRDRHSADLRQTRLRGSAETIPTLGDILPLIDGKVGLLIEVKAPGRRVAPLIRAVNEALDAYSGPVGIMSFNPGVGHFLARFAPDRLRGLVVTEAGVPNRGRLCRRFSLAWSSPDFLAWDIKDLPSTFAESSRRRGLKILTWTCLSDEDRALGAAHADQIIFETEA